MIKLNNYINEAWSGVKQHTNNTEIEAWCGEMGIQDYTINSKGEIDVDNNVDLDYNDFKELPYKFGKVNGFFSIKNCKNLTSLKNCPNFVDRMFSCSNCLQLESLKGCPQEVGTNIYCSWCKKLTSLEGCPKKVGRGFYCGGCKRDFTKEEIQSLCDIKKNNIYV